MCKKIQRGGGAEKYHADEKYKEAVAVAVEACAADMPVAQGVLGENHELVLMMRCSCAEAVYKDPGWSHDVIHEAVVRLFVTARDAQHVLGTSHPTTTWIERSLRLSQKALHRARDLKNARGKAECLQKVLRFPVGTRVECSVNCFDGWQEGRVVGHWYREASMPPGHFMPYQIKLDRGVLIFARRDEDKMIRRAID